jgi:hypothetical protein
MIRSLSSAVFVALVSVTGACAQSQPANTAQNTPPPENTAGTPPAYNSMNGQTMMMADGGMATMNSQGMESQGMTESQSSNYGMKDAGMYGQGSYGQGQGSYGQNSTYGQSNTYEQNTYSGQSQSHGQGVTETQGSSYGMKDAGSSMGTMGGGTDACPMLLPGTTVQAQETKDGMSMTFTTSGGDVGELRRRVRMMADHMNSQSTGSSGTGMQGGTTGGSTTGGSTTGSSTTGSSTTGGSMSDSSTGGMMMPMHATVANIDKGATLKTTPDDPSKLSEMRAHMKAHARMMNQTHSCSMMAMDAGQY